MKLRSHEPFWLLKNGLINAYPRLEVDISCDVLIIGGGITGALMAYQLSGEGYNVVVIDKRDVGLGSTCATTAMLQYELDEPLHSLITHVGKRAAVDTYLEGVKAINDLEAIVHQVQSPCGFEPKQSLYVAHNPKALRSLEKEFKSRRESKLDVSWLTKPDLDEYNITGEGAILSSAGGSLDAYRLTHDLLDHCRINFGLRVYDHTLADEIEFKNDRPLIKTNTGNIIQPASIVFASGYETQYFLEKKIVKLISTYATISEPLVVPPWLNNTIVWNTDDPYLYVRSTPDGRVLIGGKDEPFKTSEKRDVLIDEKEKCLVESIHQFLPALTIIPDFTWAGTFGVTKDTMPYIGALRDFPHCYFVLGFGGNGITFSVMGMKIISDAMAGNKNRFLEYYSFTR